MVFPMPMSAVAMPGVPPVACWSWKACSTCSPRSPKEQRIAERLHFPPTIRLACQTHISGPVRIRRLIIDDEDVELHNLSSANYQSAVVGVEKGIFILFADIQGFTAFAETLMPYDVVHVLNRYFNLMDKAIKPQQGYINSYMGDGLMALFETADSVGRGRAVHSGRVGNAYRSGKDAAVSTRSLSPQL